MCFCNPEDRYENHKYGHPWEVEMSEAACENPKGCLYGYFCGCCAAYTLRMQAIDNNIDNYLCFQGYSGISRPKGEPDGQGGLQPPQQGKCVSCCPSCCLCLEATCCSCASLSATKMYVTDQHALQISGCDKCFVWTSNACMCIACLWKWAVMFPIRVLTICYCFYIFWPVCYPIEELPWIIATCYACCVGGCMSAQIDRQLEQGKVPPGWELERDFELGFKARPPQPQVMMVPVPAGQVVMQGQPVQGQPVQGQMVMQGQPVQGQPVIMQQAPQQQGQPISPAQVHMQ